MGNKESKGGKGRMEKGRVIEEIRIRGGKYIKWKN